MIEAWLVIARGVHFFACLLIAGVWAYDQSLVAREVQGIWRPIARNLLMFAFPLALISGIGWLICVAADMSGQPLTEAVQPSTLLLVLNKTHFGAIWRWRVAFWIIAVGAAVLMKWLRIPRWIALAASFTLLLSLAWAGHGIVGPSPARHIAADVLHLAAAACWPTCLLPLALVLLKLRSAGFSGQRMVIAALLRRFSVLAVISVCILALSGFVNSYYLVGSFANLFAVPYGRLLLAKVLLFFLTVGIGAVNLLRHKPRVSADPSASGERSLTRLQYNIAAELVLFTLILVLTALLGVSMPAGQIK
jgi:copper resistance protein D